MKYRPIEKLEGLERSRGVCYHHQVYGILLRALMDGTIAAGTALPTENEMMERFQVSRNTIRRALGRLEDEKRIVRRRGSGSYARSVPLAQISAEELTEIVERDDERRPQTTGRLLRVHMVDTPEFIRRREPRFAATSLMVQRLQSLKSVPFLLTISHVPEHLAAKLTRSVLSRQAVLSALDSQGLKAFSGEQMTTAVAADATAARHLEIETSSPLMSVHRLVRDGDGHPIEYQIMQYPPGRFIIRDAMLIERADTGLQWSRSRSTPVPAWL